MRWLGSFSFLVLLSQSACGDDGATDGGTDAAGDVSTPDAGDTSTSDVGPDTSVPQDPELVYVDDFEFAGAFRVPADMYGASELNYSEGPIAVEGTSFYVVGHAHQQAIAEFTMPELVASETISDLNMAGAPDQVFVQVLDRVADNPQAIDRVGGMKVIDGELVVNGYEYYDAAGDNTHTTLVVRDASDLAAGVVDGFFSFAGGAHTSGWISDIPSEWQGPLGGTMVTGSSSGRPIIGRLSVGPSAFVFDPSDIVGAASVPDPVPTSALLDYDLSMPLHDDLSNDTGANDLWTHLSRAVFGFVVPGTRSYVTLGETGGHGPEGVCYKCVPNGETAECGGYCSVDPDDYSLYYWFYDVDDLVAVGAGSMAPHEVRPYAYGAFPSPYSTNQMGGGAYDAASGLLYLTMQAADREQGDFANPPVVVAFRIAAGS